MRKDTKKMLNLLIKLGSVNDNEAGRHVLNPRREAGLIKSRTEHEVRINQQSNTKREYTLIQ